MRYLTVLATPTEDGSFHPLGKKLTAEPTIEREAIHHVDLLADGTVLLFGKGSGDRARYEEIMRNSPHVVDYLVAGEEKWTAVSRFEPTDTTRHALELKRESNVVIEMPIRIGTDGSLRITYVGSDADIQTLYRDIAGEPHLAFEVLETGEYEPTIGPFSRALTTRQQEVLEVAVEVGYYTTPRRSTLEDVAATVGIAPTTAGEHLRKIEERVFTELVR